MSLMTPFGTPAAPAGTPSPSPVPEPEPTGSSRRPLLLVGVVLALLAAVAGAYLLFFSGPGEDDASAYTFTLPARTAKVVPPLTPTAAPTAIVRQAAVKARNPFVPLVSAPSAPGAGASSGGSTPGSPATGVPLPTRIPVASPVPVVPAPPVVPVAPAVPVAPVKPVTPVVVPVPPVATVTTAVRMGLVDEDNGIAHVTVDAISRLVVPGQTIGGFTLLNLRDGRCGALQRGSTVFDLCEGSSRTFG